MLAVGEIRGGQSLKSFSVADGNEIRFSDVQNEGDVGREIEVHRKRDKFVKGKKIFGFIKLFLKNENYRLFLRM